MQWTQARLQTWVAHPQARRVLPFPGLLAGRRFDIRAWEPTLDACYETADVRTIQR